MHLAKRSHRAVVRLAEGGVLCLVKRFVLYLAKQEGPGGEARGGTRGD